MSVDDAMRRVMDYKAAKIARWGDDPYEDGGRDLTGDMAILARAYLKELTDRRRASRSDAGGVTECSRA